MPTQFVMTEDQKRRSDQVLDAIANLGCAPERTKNAAIVIVVVNGVITTIDIAQSVTTKTLSGIPDRQDGSDWNVTGPTSPWPGV